ncbi:hypothetical protein L7F22_032447 [Adiantum nelumboides]|nr:hypothetical protein [Adiantum nelumboides]
MVEASRVTGTLIPSHAIARCLIRRARFGSNVRIGARDALFSQRWICRHRHLQRSRLLLKAHIVDEGGVATDGNPPLRINSNPNPKPITSFADDEETMALARSLFGSWAPPRYLWRAVATLIIAGQVVLRILQGRVHLRNTLQQLESVGPHSLGVCLLTGSFVGMAFTIQFVREFARLGLTRAVGGVLSLALSRELSPVVTAIIVAGRVGSAFAAELGTMQVSEQTDTLRVLRTAPSIILSHRV